MLFDTMNVRVGTMWVT